MDLTNKVVLVTGASRGLGREIALAFGREGCKVIVNHRDSYAATTRLVDSLPDAIVGGGDVSNVEEVCSLMEGIRSTYGRLDVLVNNAGWTKSILDYDLEALTPEVFDRVMRTNVYGSYNCIREAIKTGLMTEGAIVNVSSIAAQTASGSNVAYCASKAAIESMTRSLGRALGPNIRVNAVAPGLMETDMTSAWRDYHARAIETNPLRREPTLRDVADTVVYLARNESITGTIVNVDAGQSLV